MKWEYAGEELFDNTADGIFIINQGNFQYGNASLSFYNPDTKTIDNEIFNRANGMKLGDVAQSMTVYRNQGWIVVNNSHVIFRIDLNTYRETGRIQNLPSPRYICIINPSKAYVSQLWDNRIIIVNPTSMQVTGEITIPNMAPTSGSTEQMILIGKHVYCNCWSYQNRIIKIDTTTDAVTASLPIGVQPQSMVKDCNDKLWVLTDGGFSGNPAGHEPPTLARVDPQTMTVEKRFQMQLNDSPSQLQIDPTGHTLYWINNDIFRMDISAESAPKCAFINACNTKYYGLFISPVDHNIYVADAIDYQQLGMIYRYDSAGNLIDTFHSGVTPGAFAWKGGLDEI